jgi:TonB family protein
MKRILIAAVIVVAPAICPAQPVINAPPASTSPSAATTPAPALSNNVVLPSTAGMARHICPVRDDRFGTVTLAFRIDIKGVPRNIIVQKSSGYSDIDRNSITCVSEWKYIPAEFSDNPIESLWSADVQFSPGPPRRTGPYVDPLLRLCPGYPKSDLPNPKPTVALITIGADGALADTSLVQSSGDSSLDQFALACASKVSFKQDIASGQQTAGRLLFPIFWPRQSK